MSLALSKYGCLREYANLLGFIANEANNANAANFLLEIFARFEKQAA
jgi:hypothetical protein